MVEIWNEYISRDAVMDMLGDQHRKAKSMEAIVLIDDIRRAALVIPAADVVKVRNGVWAESCSHGVWHYDCPFCGDGYATKERQEKPENYCSNCGARMDGKRKAVSKHDENKSVLRPLWERDRRNS